ncbi:MAG: hypothetical protein KatS3mg101_1021 [Patescibacteria group bacterium]|nr:MAG: hypothetical protein KatS3mg101_1021 [Patescibacteria group bacterium]
MINQQLQKELPIIISIFITVAFWGWDIQRMKHPEEIYANYSEVETSPNQSETAKKPKDNGMVNQKQQDPLESNTERQKTQKEEIEDYIQIKFKDDYEKAMLLLRGDGQCGGENPNLDPYAVNVNKDGSRDRGIFQINNKYHPLTDDEAFNWQTNIDYAYRMYLNDNKTFKRWTAGKCMNI